MKEIYTIGQSESGAEYAYIAMSLVEFWDSLGERNIDHLGVLNNISSFVHDNYCVELNEETLSSIGDKIKWLYENIIGIDEARVLWNKKYPDDILDDLDGSEIISVIDDFGFMKKITTEIFNDSNVQKTIIKSQNKRLKENFGRDLGDLLN